MYRTVTIVNNTALHIWKLGERILRILIRRKKVFVTMYGEGERENHSVVSDSLWPHRLYSSCNSPGQNTRVGSHWSSWHRNQTGVSCIARGFFTSWATREATVMDINWTYCDDNFTIYIKTELCCISETNIMLCQLYFNKNKGKNKLVHY